MGTLNRKEISEALIHAMEKEDLNTRAVAKFLNLNPCYISMAQNPKIWDSMSNPAWVRLEEWYETRGPIALFEIPGEEEIWKPKEKVENQDKRQKIKVRKRMPLRKGKKEVDEIVKKLDIHPVQNEPKQEPQFTDAVRLKVALDIEINLVVNGQKVQLR